jgi:hypothetical protein
MVQTTMEDHLVAMTAADVDTTLTMKERETSTMVAETKARVGLSSLISTEVVVDIALIAQSKAMIKAMTRAMALDSTKTEVVIEEAASVAVEEVVEITVETDAEVVAMVVEIAWVTTTTNKTTTVSMVRIMETLEDIRVLAGIEAEAEARSDMKHGY